MTDDYYTIVRGRPYRAADGVTTVRVRLDGEFDLAARPALIDELTAAAGDGTRILVDLDRVTMLDSEAIGALLAGFEAVRHDATRFRLANARGVVRRVLDISGLSFLFATDPAAG
ncbi:Anti-sigma F factor antagonist [Actinoplanes sp. SE50]|uniref:STAS domain-containing protein n=1 Tax=unclassified Actinoplanes TaxID=2626549 RepID=UPI00023ED5FC|nr:MULTISPECIES: STAS domain-containing protein [unclassified Actinoplanes]AEV84477.1 Anti-sigma F factor antagonist [Actinoplanes sp. SE50/110]ATO82869.1 Anti-sigma F factor antagonist [Actinoplanes sp. SE50]SLM00277.1 anti-sigma F factor antagonist [Actinoplanes sp. SE50/110]